MRFSLKITFCLVLSLLLLNVLNASLGWSYVTSETHCSTVQRIVIGLVGVGEPEVSQLADGIKVQIADFDPNSKARINHTPNDLVSGIMQTEGTIILAIKGGFRYEKSLFEQPKRFVVDVFRASPNQEQRLTIAGFYAEMGKLNSADQVYAALNRDYPADSQVLYKWAQLLMKRGSSRATEKLMQIPQDSGYYRQAQALLARIHGDEEPLPPPPPMPEIETPAVVSQDSVAVKDTIIAAPQQSPEAYKAEKIKLQINYLPIFVILAALLGIVIIVYNMSKKRYVKTSSAPPSIDLPTGLDSKTICRMVDRLMADGWTQREIANELKMSQRELERYVQLCHQGGHDEDNS